MRHFTATAFVTDDQNRVLLMWHKRMQRWMPPGGHVQADELPEETAKRECKEETGLDVEILGEPTQDFFTANPHEGRMLKKPFAMLLETIPASEERGEPAHEHMDFLFHAKMIDPTQNVIVAPEEGHELRWFTREEIALLDESKEIFSNVKVYALLLLESV